MNWGAVIVAAGHGTRFGRPKQLVELAGKPMIAWSVDTFASMPEIAELIVVTEPEFVEVMEVLVEERDHQTGDQPDGAPYQLARCETVDRSFDGVQLGFEQHLRGRHDEHADDGADHRRADHEGVLPLLAGDVQ